LSSLRVGDTLIAIDEEKGQPFNSSANAYRRWRLSTVEAITECVLPAVKIVMVDGTVFVCSTRHSWLAPSSGTSVWSESRFLRSGKVYPGSSKITKILDVWQEDRSWEAGYLAAGVDGEGHLTQFDNPGRGHSKQLRLGFSQRENAMLAAFNLAADALGFKFCRAGSLNFALTGGKSKTLEFLGRVRPRRLLAKFDPARIGTVHRMANVPVETVEHIGEQKLTALKTSTGCFVAEGFAAHDSSQTSNSCTRKSRIVRYRGQDMHLSDAIAISGLKENTVRNRLHIGWSVEQALSEPLMRPASVGNTRPPRAP
jgi:hypothetical protein